jgi:hypothetical protein
MIRVSDDTMTAKAKLKHCFISSKQRSIVKRQSMLKVPGADFSAARRRISVCRAVAKLPELPPDDDDAVVVASSSSVLVESVLDTWLTDLQRAA